MNNMNDYVDGFKEQFKKSRKWIIFWIVGLLVWFIMC